ncbi:MAG TPA: hypothetical protein VNK43_01330 [Gemmatimonadales bacterium]|nr:hypothetical protein [Gemmatimonadales bacterium]
MRDEIQRVLDPFLAAADAALRDRYSALLYGSAAWGGYVPGISDINVMLIAEEVTPETLRAMDRAFAVFRKAGFPPPLFMSRAEWRRAADAFPIEITDMQSAYKLLRGPDPLEGVRVEPADLRRALEREVRGVLMRLRQGYAAWADDEKSLSALAAESVKTVLLYLRSVLVLLGRDAPHDPPRLAVAGALAIGFPQLDLLRMVGHRGDRAWRCSADEFVRYLGVVETTARYVDELQLGDHR